MHGIISWKTYVTAMILQQFDSNIVYIVISRSFTLWELDLFVKNYKWISPSVCNFILSRIPFKFNWFWFSDSVKYCVSRKIWHCGNRNRSRRGASFEWFETTTQFAYIVADYLLYLCKYIIHICMYVLYLIFSLSRLVSVLSTFLACIASWPMQFNSYF